MIFIPPDLYVGRLKRDNDNILGFMVPDGTDKAAESRKATVDRWAGERSWGQTESPSLEPLLLKNVPLTKYTLNDTVRRTGYNGGNVVWRVSDPRGFDLEIASDNLAGILESVGVLAGGEIPGECIWAREGSRNLLVPLESETYKSITSVVDQKPKKLTPKDLKLGWAYEHTKQGKLTYIGRVRVKLAKGVQGGAEIDFFGFSQARYAENTHKLILLRNPPKAVVIGPDPEPLEISSKALMHLANEDLGYEVERRYTIPPRQRSTYDPNQYYTWRCYEHERYLQHVEDGCLVRITEDHPLWNDDEEIRKTSGYYGRASCYVYFPNESNIWSGYCVSLELLKEGAV